MSSDQEEAAARAAATSIVAAELRGPIALVTDDAVRLCSDRHGNVRLPMVPVQNVTSVAFDDGTTMSLEHLVIDGYLIQGLPWESWVTVTYDHGWSEVQVPDIVRTVVDRLTERFLRTPDDTIRGESFGPYRVDYVADARKLSDDEKRWLARVRRVAPNNTTMATVSPPQPALSPFFGGGWW